jgi:hypothetical protein
MPVRYTGVSPRPLECLTPSGSRNGCRPWATTVRETCEFAVWICDPERVRHSRGLGETLDGAPAEYPNPEGVGTNVRTHHPGFTLAFGLANPFGVADWVSEIWVWMRN